MSARQPEISDRWLNRNVVGLAVNQFLPDSVTRRGRRSSHCSWRRSAPAAALGLIEGVADGLSSFAKLLGGWLGDRVERRRPWAAAGYLLTGVTTGLYGLFAWWPWILLVRAWAGPDEGCDRRFTTLCLRTRSPQRREGAPLVSMRRPTPPGRSPVHWRRWRLSDSRRAVCTGCIISMLFSGWRRSPEFWRRSRSLRSSSNVSTHILEETSLIGSLRLLPSSFRRYLAGVFVFGCGDFSHTMLILYAVQSLTGRYGQSAGTIAIGLYALHTVLYAVGSYPAGVFADRYGKGRFLLAAYALAVLMNLILIVAAPSVATLLVVFILAGAAYALQQSLERAIAADMAPIEVRSTGFGALASANGIGDLVSSVIVGTLWTTVSPVAGFCYAMAMSVAGAIVTGAALRAVRDA